MSFDFERFGMFRPYLFHLTDRANLSGIRASNTIECASALLSRGRDRALLTVRRDSHRTIEFDTHQVLIRDQKPLHEGAIAFETGWNLPRFVQHVNDHVFFLAWIADGTHQTWSQSLSKICGTRSWRLYGCNGVAPPRKSANRAVVFEVQFRRPTRSKWKPQPA